MASQASVPTGRSSWLRVVPGVGKGVKLPWLPLSVMVGLLFCSIFAPLLSPHDPTEISMLNARVAPLEDLNYPLGTDIMGRDMLSRLIFGARTAVFISLVALGMGMLVGSILGLIAGYRTGWLDILIMRASDAALGFPTILVAMIIVTILGAGVENIILAVALTVWARFARVIRGDVLSIKELDFVTSARIAGVSTPMIIWRHIFPNTINTLMVITSLQIGQRDYPSYQRDRGSNQPGEGQGREVIRDHPGR